MDTFYAGWGGGVQFGISHNFFAPPGFLKLFLYPPQRALKFSFPPPHPQRDPGKNCTGANIGIPQGRRRVF